MVNVLTSAGEEYLVKKNTDGDSLDIGLYNDSVDNLSDSATLDSITTEPNTANEYKRQTDIYSATTSGNWGIQNTNNMTFIITTNTEVVDSYFLVADFDSTETGVNGENLIAAGDLGQERDLDPLSELSISANQAQVLQGVSQINVQDDDVDILKTGVLDFHNGIDVSDAGDDSVTIDVSSSSIAADTIYGTNIASGTITASGGSTPAVDTMITGISSDQLSDFIVTVDVDSDPTSFNSDYAFNYDYSHSWDNSDSEIDINLVVNWDIDPGSGNDVSLGYKVIEKT